MQKSIHEIGSEFWIKAVPETLLTDRDGTYTISGRTAIDTILQDILKKRSVRSVYMPAWCCDSMLAPFVARDIQIQFYDICLDKQISCQPAITEHTDIFYLTNYFGYENTVSVGIVKEFKEKGSIILYDRTHSFLMDDVKYCELADYSFASLRKWMGVVGGAVVSGLINEPKLLDCPYASIKEVAMLDKWKYLNGDASIIKEDFLNAFGAFGHHLADDYINYEMDALSYTLYKQEDLEEMRKRRRENAAYLHEHLKGVPFIGELTDKEAPLFVPVFFENKLQRDSIRKRLIENNIYCPVHWPKPQQIPAGFAVNEIYDTELSLICDQRYGVEEMKEITNNINAEL